MSLTRTQFFAVVTTSLIFVAVNLTSVHLSHEPVIEQTWSTENVIPVLYWLGELLGYIIGGILIELVGRKRTLLAMSIPFIVSWILISVGEERYLMYAARILLEFCAANVFLCSLVYVAEIAHAKFRGGLVLLVANIWYFFDLTNTLVSTFLEWKNFGFFVSMGLIIPFMILMCFAHESPRWFVYRGKDMHARISLEWLRGRDNDVRPEWNEIVNTHRRRNTWCQSRHVIPLATGCGVAFFLQFCGFKIVPYLLVLFLVQSQWSLHITWMLTVCIVLSRFLAMLLVDHVGRKVLLFISQMLMTVSLALLALYYYFRLHHVEVVIGNEWAAICCFFLYIAGHHIGSGPVSWLYICEIYPGKIRGPAVAGTLVVEWILSLFADALTRYTYIEDPYIMFTVYASISFVGLFFIGFAVPETKRESLEEVERYTM